VLEDVFALYAPIKKEPKKEGVFKSQKKKKASSPFALPHHSRVIMDCPFEDKSALVLQSRDHLPVSDGVRAFLRVHG